MPGWLGQVGSLSHTVRLPSVEAMKSAATRRAPVPPGAWAVTARPLASNADVGAEEQRLGRRVELGQPIDGQIVLGGLGRQQPLFGGLDRGEHRRAPAGVLVDADAEVDLLRVGIFLEGLGQAEDGVRGGGD